MAGVAIASPVSVARDEKGEVVYLSGVLPCFDFSYSEAVFLEYALERHACDFPCPGVQEAHAGAAFEMHMSENARADPDRGTAFFDRALEKPGKVALRAFRREAVEWATQVLTLFVGEEDWSASWANNESVVFGFEGAKRAQEPHVNSHKHEWFVYASLSGELVPAQLHCPSEASKVPELEEELAGADPRDLDKMRALTFYYTFSELMRKSEEVAKALVPVAPGGAQWDTGAICVVRGDQIVAAPPFDGYRAVLFFSISPPIGNSFSPRTQVTPTSFFARLTALSRGMKKETRKAAASAALRRAREHEAHEPWRKLEGEGDKVAARAIRGVCTGKRKLGDCAEAYVQFLQC